MSRHSRATEVSVKSRYAGGILTVEVGDNGCGLSDGRLEDPLSFGIRGMRERARAHRGDMQVTGKPGRGTVVSITFPVSASNRAEGGPRRPEKP